MKKGEYGCRCECCIYWRRHIHRVAGNRDREVKKYESIASHHRTQSASKDKKMGILLESLWALQTKERRQRAEIAGIKEELRNLKQKPSLFKRLLGGLYID